MLKLSGRAAAVVQNTVLCEGGVGEMVRKRSFRKQQMVTTIRRLPTDIFYANGVKAKRDLLRQQIQQQKPVDKEI